MEPNLLPHLRRNIIRNIRQIRRHPVFLQPTHNNIMHLRLSRHHTLRRRELRERLVIEERLLASRGRVDPEYHAGLTVRRCAGRGAGLTTVAPDGGGGVHGDVEGGRGRG